MSLESEAERLKLNLEKDEEGDLTPAALAKLKRHLDQGKKVAKREACRKFMNEGNARRRKAKSQVITADNAAEKVKTLNVIQKLAENKVNVIDSVAAQEANTYYPELLQSKEIGWEPFPGPQTHFLEADEFEVLFSGGRAPGKSDALMMDAARYCQYGDFRGLVIRKAMKELRDLIKRAKELYPKMYPGTRWKEQEKLFVFPSGAVIEFGYCDHAEDVEQYKGQEYSWLGIDELTEIPTEEMYERLIASVRKKSKHFKTYVRCTTNPNGVGKTWVKRRFIDKGPANKTIFNETYIPQLKKSISTTRKWIHGTVFDNPKIVEQNPEYIALLSSIDNVILRAQWLEGDWDSADGLAFDEFSRATHVIEPFEVPYSWHRFRACDWGFKTKAVNLWFAVSPEGTIYVYREFVAGAQTPRGKMQAREFGAELRRIEEEAGETVRYGILDASAWAERGENAPSPAEDMAGLVWRQSDRSRHSRITGKLQVHSYLQVDPETNEPGVYIFNTCTDLISCISSIAIDKNSPEDVDTKGDDHAYDAFRYGLMSRPKTFNRYDFETLYQDSPTITNTTFGY